MDNDNPQRSTHRNIMDQEQLLKCIGQVHTHANSLLSCSPSSLPILPSPSALSNAISSLPAHLPEDGHTLPRTVEHLLSSIAPALSASSLSPNYYGLVTGGVTPAARVADELVSLYDQNVALHVPEESVSSVVEDRALKWLMELLDLEPGQWPGRTFTTVATGSNVLGMACGREYVLSERFKGVSIGELGILEACARAGVERFQVLTTRGHSSLFKAASVVGLGRGSVIDVGKEDDGLAFDMDMLGGFLKGRGAASIVVVSCGEINTGRFATYSNEEMSRLRTLCDDHGAWLHVDGAFGIFSRLLANDPEFERVANGTLGVQIADSITGDCHKLLNVPYDCGFFFCRHPGITQQVFQNPNAAYLNTSKGSTSAIPSNLNVSLENSRRQRGLPVYATLMAYGREGYRDLVKRVVRFARMVAEYVDSHEDLELLPERRPGSKPHIEDVYMIVLFRAKDVGLNEILIKKINDSNRMYVTGTVWQGKPASRIAVSNWQADPQRDLEVVKTTFGQLLAP